MLQWHTPAVWRACTGASTRQSSAAVCRWPQCTVYCAYCSFNAQQCRLCVALGAASVCLGAVRFIASSSISVLLALHVPTFAVQLTAFHCALCGLLACA